MTPVSQRWMDHWGSLASHPNYIRKYQANERLYLEITGMTPEEGQKMLTSGATHTCIYLTHTHEHIRKNKVIFTCNPLGQTAHEKDQSLLANETATYSLNA